MPPSQRKKVIVITGAAGFLGSALTVDLAGDFQIIALDQRVPSAPLQKTVPEVPWEIVDISKSEQVDAFFQDTIRRYGRVDFILHFAAYYHFGNEWRAPYTQSNIRGTSHILRAGERVGAGRIVFASSIAAQIPPPPGEALTEHSPTSDYIPYARSKSIGERRVREYSSRLPGVVLRIGGVFDDWCELPALYSLIKLWGGPSPLNHCIPGRGLTGMPYLHRRDLVGMVRRCIEYRDRLGPYEILFASQDGAVTHKELSAGLWTLVRTTPPRGISIPKRYMSWALHLQSILRNLTGDVVFEKPWMMNYIDRPWTVDTRHTREKLGWKAAPGYGLLERLPVLMERFTSQRKKWEKYNRRRIAGEYHYHY
jgi:nucleoside-diphosphate-sugar epimerase